MRIPLKLCAVFFFAYLSLSSSAQNPKFGHIDLQAFIQVLPDLEDTEKAFDKFQKEMDEVLTEMQKNYQAKLVELEKLGADASDVKRNAVISDVQNLYDRIQVFQQNARQQVQQKYQDLLNPLYEKALRTVEEVAREMELLYVFETGSNVILYKSNQSIDLLPLVKKKLGIEQ
jgi:outer membrane protein